ncbi:hypothetical protein F2Q69_00015497 [Brassica cretica]|uniref:Pectinesterase inhibitor domain-containing protein n=1 Tax=Brassica cretica TaxID=69181 RepID=A0A8S9R8M7_BRACR|nr:hypothetical protein F2Q69_00015497 [Brassica cretica]
MRGSMKQMKELVSTGSVQTFKFQMSNVKTWLSAALTNEYTCTNGFEDFHDDGSIKDDFVISVVHTHRGQEQGFDGSGYFEGRWELLVVVSPGESCC